MLYASRKIPLREHIYSAMRTQILTGQLKPGQRIVELQVAKTFGSSQPLREALQRLQEEGLVEIISHTGTFVSDISYLEMRELFEFRKTLERNALQATVKRIGMKEIHQLENIVSEMMAAAENNDIVQFTMFDVEFHRTIIEWAGRKVSLKVWSLLDGQIRRFIATTTSRYYSDLAAIAQTHIPLLEAIKRKDLEEALALFEQHLDITWAEIFERDVEK